MNNTGCNRDLGAILPKPRAATFEDKVWYSFVDEFNELISETLAFSNENLRIENEDFSEPWGELFGYLCEEWTSLKGSTQEADQSDFYAHSVIVALTHFAHLATEPQKPRGINSSSKNRDEGVRVDPSKIIDEVDFLLSQLIGRLESEPWTPTNALTSFRKASSNLIEGKTAFKLALRRAKTRSQREAAIFESLLDAYGPNSEATVKGSINDLVKKMKSLGFTLNKYIDGWRDRVRQFYKAKKLDSGKK